ncbi:MAG: DUF45 domain-containing protein [Bacteroidaceae bacterium]|nr:DUF45 domain-containing protein [Bacteroidaceae bacterium]MBQ3958599.1 DUF45 domain-containing protein [Bacteroidaceae bacterium]
MATKEMESVVDAELGVIGVRRNAQARRFVFRVRDGQLWATTPWRASHAELLRAIETLRPRLIRMLERAAAQKPALIDATFRIDAECFTFSLQCARVSQLRTEERRGLLTCYYPEGFDFTPPHVQAWLRRAVTESLRHHAQVIFPPRLRQLAEARGLRYNTLRIHASRSRWGSCTARGNINLSLFLMLLPTALQDYIMQHELTHLIEMNHGPRFYALLDEAVGGRHESLRRQLKQFSLSTLFP